MCYQCTGGYWPWTHTVQTQKAPLKEEYIYLDANHGFYPDYRQGIHSAGPIYTSNQPGGPVPPSQSWYNPYYGAQAPSAQAGYYCQGQYHPFQAAGVSGAAGTFPMPFPNDPHSLSAQAAAAAAANASLAAMPAGPAYFVGGGPMDFAAQQAYLAANMGIVNQTPTQLAPYKPSDGQQFWCKETDGSWTLRTYNDIILGDVSPGHWERHATSGYFYWVRQQA